MNQFFLMTEAESRKEGKVQAAVHWEEEGYGQGLWECGNQLMRVHNPWLCKTCPGWGYKSESKIDGPAKWEETGLP